LRKAESRLREDLEHERNGALVGDIVDEGAVVDGEAPVLAVLRDVRTGDLSQLGVDLDSYRFALDHDVEALAESVAACSQDHIWISLEVLSLALVWSRAEVQHTIEPDGDQRGYVRAPVGTHRRQPKTSASSRCLPASSQFAAVAPSLL